MIKYIDRDHAFAIAPTGYKYRYSGWSGFSSRISDYSGRTGSRQLSGVVQTFSGKAKTGRS